MEGYLKNKFEEMEMFEYERAVVEMVELFRLKFGRYPATKSGIIADIIKNTLETKVDGEYLNPAYLIFGYSEYYPSGGGNDLIAYVKDGGEIVIVADGCHTFEYFQILDARTLKALEIVEKDGRSNSWDSLLRKDLYTKKEGQSAKVLGEFLERIKILRERGVFTERETASHFLRCQMMQIGVIDDIGVNKQLQIILYYIPVDRRWEYGVSDEVVVANYIDESMKVLFGKCVNPLYENIMVYLRNTKDVGERK